MPLAHAFSHAGHQVCFATHAHEREFLEGAGLPYVIVSPGLDMTNIMRMDGAGQVKPAASDSAPKTAQGSESALDEKDTAGVVAGKLSVLGILVSSYMTDEEFTNNLTQFAQEWEADVIVWDALSYGGSVAAGVSGAVSVRNLFAIDQFAILRERYLELGGQGDPLSSRLRSQVIRLGGEYGQDEADLQRLVYGDMTLNPLPDYTQPPASYQRMDITYPGFFGGEMPAGSWTRGTGHRPRVCVTIGVSSLRYQLQLPPLKPLLDALQDLSVDVMVTVGPAQAREFGLFREGFTYLEGAPLEGLLPAVDLVIHHFGTGTLLTAFRNAVPQVHLEAPTDYWGEKKLSESLHRTGHVWTIDFADASTDSIHATLERILADPSARNRAEASRDAYLSRPALSRTVEQIVEYAAYHQAVRAPRAADDSEMTRSSGGL